MKFAIVAFAAVAMAEARRQAGFNRTRNDSNTDAAETKRFTEWSSKQGRGYESTREFQTRLALWKASDEKINATNAAADASGDPFALRLKHTKFSDRTEKEKLQSLGYKPQQTRDGRKDGRKLEAVDNKQGRRLAVTAADVDWAADGTAGPVKDQGACGSCYAFASNTVLEATASIQKGVPYQRLSEQQIVDCANYNIDTRYYNFGCQGGFMDQVWEYQMDYGAMTNAEYPYVSGTTS